MKLGVHQIDATGTRSDTTFLRGDGAWETPAGGGGGGAFSGVKVYRSAAYSMANNAITVMPWDAEEYDTDGFHDNAVNNSRLTVPVGLSGKYNVKVSMGSDASMTNRFIVAVRKNGTVIRGGNVEVNSGGAFPMLSVSCDVDLAEGDYIDSTYYQNSGSTKSFYNAQCAMSMFKIG